jgi:hypothetical protein
MIPHDKLAKQMLSIWNYNYDFTVKDQFEQMEPPKFGFFTTTAKKVKIKGKFKNKKQIGGIKVTTSDGTNLSYKATVKYIR